MGGPLPLQTSTWLDDVAAPMACKDDICSVGVLVDDEESVRVVGASVVSVVVVMLWVEIVTE